MLAGVVQGHVATSSYSPNWIAADIDACEDLWPPGSNDKTGFPLVLRAARADWQNMSSVDDNHYIEDTPKAKLDTIDKLVQLLSLEDSSRSCFKRL